MITIPLSSRMRSTGVREDFELGGFVIHVTTAPSQALIDKCLANISDGLRPLIITPYRQAPVAAGLAESADADSKIEIFDVEAFFSTNIFEWVIRGEARKASIGTSRRTLQSACQDT